MRASWRRRRQFPRRSWRARVGQRLQVMRCGGCRRRHLPDESRRAGNRRQPVHRRGFRGPGARDIVTVEVDEAVDYDPLGADPSVGWAILPILPLDRPFLVAYVRRTRQQGQPHVRRPDHCPESPLSGRGGGWKDLFLVCLRQVGQNSLSAMAATRTPGISPVKWTAEATKKAFFFAAASTRPTSPCGRGAQGALGRRGPRCMSDDTPRSVQRHLSGLPVRDRRLPAAGRGRRSADPL